MRGRNEACRRIVAVALGLAVMGVGRQASAEAVLQSKAVELGLTGAILSVEGTSTVRLGVRTGQFRYAGRIPVQYSFGLAYSRVSDVDELELEAALSGFFRMSETETYAFAGVAGALRQEWVGSFNHDRYALGLDLGVKFLASAAAAGTITYQFRHLFNDPVSNFNEHRVIFGISLIFGNSPQSEEP